MTESGTDHDVWVSPTGTVLRRIRPGSDSLDVEREAALLRLVAELSPLEVPRVLAARPDEGVMEMTRLPGRPLLATPAPATEVLCSLAEQLGAFVATLGQCAPELLADIVDTDPSGPSDHRAESREIVHRHREVLPTASWPAVEEFLDSEPAPPASELVLCHRDLGAEHVLVLEAPWRISGVVDWSDAAIGDPALDLGLLLRDLGEPAFRRALAAYTGSGGDGRDLVPRAYDYARSRALEDLAYGLESQRPAYTENALRSFTWLFPAVTRR